MDEQNNENTSENENKSIIINKTFEFKLTEEEFQKKLNKMYNKSCMDRNMENIEFLYNLGANPIGHDRNIMFKYMFRHISEYRCTKKI